MFGVEWKCRVSNTLISKLGHNSYSNFFSYSSSHHQIFIIIENARFIGMF